MPVSFPVALPPLLVKVTWPLNAPVPDGVKLTTTSAEPLAGTVNEPPETMANGLPPAVALPLRLLPAVLVMVNVACADEPTATEPKSRAGGLAASAPGTLTLLSGSEPKLNSSRLV